MDTLLLVFAIICGITGILGSILPVLPGPPISWVGLLLVFLRGGVNGDGEPMGLAFLLVWLAVTLLVTLLDYIVPAWFTKLGGGSKYAGWGATLGLLAGLIFPMPVGMIACSLIGAFLFELMFAGKTAGASLKASLGAFAGFLFGTGAKLICCALMMYYIIVYFYA